MSTRLLLASDYAMVREGLRLLLGSRKEIKLVGEAEHLGEASQKVCELRPDVVLLDVAGRNAYSGLQTVRHIVDKASDARIVVVTNNDNVSYAKSTLASGARGYVLKHSPSADLITAIRVIGAGEKFIDHRLRPALALTHGSSQTGKRPSLSKREFEVMRELALGYTNPQIATQMKLTLRTIETYRARIYRKLHLRSRAELVQYAIGHGLLP